MLKQLKVQPNDATKAGAPASLAAISHDWRYKVQALHTRFDAVVWFAWDAECIDEYGFATVIRQEPDFETCMLGLGIARIVGRNGKTRLPNRDDA